MRARKGGTGGGCCLCSGTVCLSPWSLLPHMLAFQKVTGIVFSTPSLGASQGAVALVYLLVRTSVYGFPVADHRDTHTQAHIHSHTGVGDHVGCCRMSLNPRMSQNLGPGQLALHGDKDDPSAASGDTPQV
uniref:Uncharacterized protein n=1 Tax=Myotis myotis TaxID=51298 RepID=A0A7J7XHW8_MYOMY|nr:hypothetical protein mMyoMyo1_011664 [Myotis myotis]